MTMETSSVPHDFVESPGLETSKRRFGRGRAPRPSAHATAAASASRPSESNSGYLTVRHGINGPNRNRWFTELNSMVIFHGYVR